MRRQPLDCKLPPMTSASSSRQHVARGPRVPQPADHYVASTFGVPIEHVTLTVIDEPFHDARLKRLSSATRRRVHRLVSRVLEDPTPCLEEAEALVAAHPDIPMLWNHFASALAANGLSQRCDSVIEETYRRFPRYVFGFCAWVRLLLRRDDAAGARALLEESPRGRLYTVRAFAPDRSEFHPSELAVYTQMMVRYLGTIGQLSLARLQFELLETTIPEHSVCAEVAKDLLFFELEANMKAGLAHMEKLERRRELRNAKKTPDRAAKHRSEPTLFESSPRG